MNTPKKPFQTLSDVKATKIEWLWNPYIPYSKITLIEGDPEVGKSYLCMHIAAVISSGGTLPTGVKVTKGNVLYITSEDDAGDTVRPRLEAMGADLTRVRVLTGFFVFSQDGIMSLRKELTEHEPDLVVIDTLFSFIPDSVDLGKPTSIRAYLHELDNMFKEFGPAVLMIRHWTKGGKGKAIYRGVGSIDIIGVVRTALVVAKDPQNECYRILAQVKNNIGEKAKSMTFELVAIEGKMPVLKWRGISSISADQLENQMPQSASEFDKAIEFLKNALRDGPMPKLLLAEKAQSKGISNSTLNRAKTQIGVIVKKQRSGWHWSLAEDPEA